MHLLWKKNPETQKGVQLNILFIGALLRNGTHDKSGFCTMPIGAANEKTHCHILHFYLDLDQQHR